MKEKCPQPFEERKEIISEIIIKNRELIKLPPVKKHEQSGFAVAKKKFPAELKGYSMNPEEKYCDFLDRKLEETEPDSFEYRAIQTLRFLIHTPGARKYFDIQTSISFTNFFTVKRKFTCPKCNSSGARDNDKNQKLNKHINCVDTWTYNFYSFPAFDGDRVCYFCFGTFSFHELVQHYRHCHHDEELKMLGLHRRILDRDPKQEANLLIPKKVTLKTPINLKGIP